MKPAAPALDDVTLVDDPQQAACLLDPVRRDLLGELAEPASAAALARRLGQPRQRLGHHLRALEHAGLLRQVAERRVRNCTERVLQASARHYLLSPAVLGGLAGDTAALRDELSEAYQAAVAGRVLSELTRLQRGARRAGQPLPTATLDGVVHLADPAAMSAFVDDLTRAVADVVERHDRPTAPGARAFRLVNLAHPLPTGHDASDADGTVTDATPPAGRPTHDTHAPPADDRPADDPAGDAAPRPRPST